LAIHDGSFNLLWSEYFSTSGDYVRDAEIGDLDNDGYNEFVIIGTSSYSVYIYDYDPSAPGTSYYQSWVAGPPQDVAALVDVNDYDNDGHTEFLTTIMWSQAEILLWENDSVGTQSWSSTVIIPIDIINAMSMGSYDMDGDSYPEIFLSESDYSPHSSLLIYEYDGSSYVKIDSLVLINGAVDDMDFGDLNGDGTVDLVVGGNGSMLEVIIYNPDTQRYEAIWNSMSFGGGHYVQSCGAGDFDGDGIHEMYAVPYFDRVRVFDWNGKTWVQDWIGNGGIRCDMRADFSGDYNNDGMDEFGVEYDDVFYMYKQAAGGGYEIERSFHANFAVVGDFDNDGASPGVAISIAPSGPTTVPAGGTLEFSTTIQNNSSNNVEGDYWLSALLPNSVEFLIPEALINYPNPLHGQIVPFGSLELSDELWVHPRADTGSYQLIGRIGNYPNAIIDEDSFEFQVVE
jgi:hypothetical protein